MDATARDLARRFGENMLIYRHRADLPQEELGFRASLRRTEISQLERGLRLPRIDTLVKLAGAFGIEPGLLLKGVSWESGEFRPGRFGLDAADPDTSPEG